MYCMMIQSNSSESSNSSAYGAAKSKSRLYAILRGLQAPKRRFVCISATVWPKAEPLRLAGEVDDEKSETEIQTY